MNELPKPRKCEVSLELLNRSGVIAENCARQLMIERCQLVNIVAAEVPRPVSKNGVVAHRGDVTGVA